MPRSEPHSTRRRTVARVSVVCIAGLGILAAVWWFLANAGPAVGPPSRVLPQPNAYDWFCSASSLLVDRNELRALDVAYLHRPRTRVRGMSEKRSLLRKNIPALAELRDGLRHGFCWPRVKDWQSSGFDIRALGRLLVLDGEVRADKGNWPGAMNAYLDALEFGAKIVRGGNLGCFEEGRNVQMDARKRIHDTYKRLTALELKAATGRMEAVRRLSVAYSEVLRQVRDQVTEDYVHLIFRNRNLFEAYDWYDRIYLATLRHDGFATGMIVKLRLLPYTKSRIVANWTRYMDKVITRVRLPYRDKHPFPPVPCDPFNERMVLDFEERWCDDLVNQADNGAMMTSLALRRFWLENSSYPASLSALVPGYLSRVPADPFSPKDALRYERTRRGYLLYSVGPDGRDDGGRPIAAYPLPKSGSTEVSTVRTYSRGDIVADVNAW